MKRMILLLALLYLISGCSQESCKYNSENTDERENLIFDLDNKTITGNYCEYYSNGNLMKKIPYKDGKKNGLEKFYHENGKLKNEIPFKDGKNDGIEKLYYESGKISREIPYKSNLYHGVYKTYYENGNLESEFSYKNGYIVDGTKKYYYQNGKKEREIPYKNGIIDGIAKYYNKNGVLIKELLYVEGKKEDFGIEYRDDGSTKFTFEYKNDQIVSGNCHKPDGTKESLTSYEIDRANSGYKIKCD